MAPVIAQMSPASQGEGQLLKQGEIPSYAEHDDFLVKVPALKEVTAFLSAEGLGILSGKVWAFQLLCRGVFRHRWPLPPQGQLFKFAPEPLLFGTFRGNCPPI
jgi:hypothetical protein